MIRFALPRLALLLVCLLPAALQAQDRPNILWISAEDHGPHLGSYGDDYATTPNLDRFAERSLRYTKASSNAPVCAPARTTIISGMYPPTLGAQHMRSRVPSPDYLKFFPRYLQEAGYYTANNHKEDYNLETDDKGWHDSSPQAHWKNRPSPDQPFFAVFNFVRTHESQIRNENESPVHDPAKAPLPPYHPDLPEIREDWAQYYDRLSLLDTFFQEKLDELKEAGLADDTIVFFWADHGSGMPRAKRYPGWSGLHVPLIVHVPDKFRHLAPERYAPGAASDRLVSFVDFAPTILSIAGLPPASYHQGHAFMGSYPSEAPQYSYGFRGRMDERPDVCRSLTDGRFVYIRNFLPHLPHGQYLDYQQQTDTTRLWYRKFNDGELPPVQSAFWKPHPREQLFDLANDPHETRNLATDPRHQQTLAKLRNALTQHLLATRDLAFYPEPMLRKIILDGRSPAGALAHRFADGANPYQSSFASSHPEQRYWQIMSLLPKGQSAVNAEQSRLAQALFDREPIVAVAAAECLATFSDDPELRQQALESLVDFSRFPENELVLTLHALNALEHARDAGAALPSSVASLQGEHPDIPQWASSYRPNLLKRIQTATTLP